jgi:hypothetical protein
MYSSRRYRPTRLFEGPEKQCRDGFHMGHGNQSCNLGSRRTSRTDAVRRKGDDKDPKPIRGSAMGVVVAPTRSRKLGSGKVNKQEDGPGARGGAGPRCEGPGRRGQSETTGSSEKMLLTWRFARLLK